MLNETVIGDSNDDKEDRQKQPDPDRGSIASFRTVHSNLTPVEHPTILPKHPTAKAPCK